MAFTGLSPAVSPVTKTTRSRFLRMMALGRGVQVEAPQFLQRHQRAGRIFEIELAQAEGGGAGRGRPAQEEVQGQAFGIQMDPAHRLPGLGHGQRPGRSGPRPRPLRAALSRSTRKRKRGSAVATVVSTSTTPGVFRKNSLTLSASRMRPA